MINLASITAVLSMAYAAVYAASKRFVLSFSEALAAPRLPAPERRARVEGLIGSSGFVLFLKGRIGCVQP